MNMAQNMHKYQPSDYITAHYIQQLEYNESVRTRHISTKMKLKE